MNGHLGDRAAAFVDGALSPEEASRARQHLVGCASCRSAVAEQQRVRQRLQRSGEPSAAGGASSVLLAALASMPVAGPPLRPDPMAHNAAGHRVGLRRGAVAGVAVGATVLATAWAAGGPVAAAGPPAVHPDRLLAQHAATAGELPFWGPRSSGTQEADGSAAAMVRYGADATALVTYRGVQVAAATGAAGRTTRVARVTHLAQHGTSTSLVGVQGSSDSAAFLPQAERRPVAGPDAVALLQDSYALIPEGADSVAGRVTDQVAAYTPGGVLAGRFWFDRESGLPLAREVRDSAGASLTEQRFTSVEVVDPVDLPRHLPVATSAGWTGSSSGAAPGPLESLGWTCPASVASAAGLTALDAMVLDTAQGPILQLVYTDGLRSLSVFEQQASLSDPVPAGLVPAEMDGHRVHEAEGIPDIVTWASGSMVFTVVADAELVDVEAVVAALPHDSAGSGSRTARGLSRVGSWFDPFG